MWPSCPAEPRNALIYGIMKLQEKIKTGSSGKLIELTAAEHH